MTRAALYARVSTADQTPETQLIALRAFATARGWQAVDFVDHGVSGAKAQGRRLGRPRLHHVDPARARALLADGLSLRAVARALRTHATTVRRVLGIAVTKPAAGEPRNPASAQGT